MPKSTLTLWEPKLITARSRFPSPLKSPAVTEVGKRPTEGSGTPGKRSVPVQAGLGRGEIASVATTWAAVGSRAVEASERMCQTPWAGSSIVRSSSPGPVEVVLGDPGPWRSPFGPMAKMSRSVGSMLDHVYLKVIRAVIVW